MFQSIFLRGNVRKVESEKYHLYCALWMKYNGAIGRMQTISYLHVFLSDKVESKNVTCPASNSLIMPHFDIQVDILWMKL